MDTRSLEGETTDEPEWVSTDVVEKVAAHRDVDEMDLPPLYETVDPDALNTLFTSEESTDSMILSFRYAGCEVTIHGPGWVTVSSPLDEESP